MSARSESDLTAGAAASFVPVGPAAALGELAAIRRQRERLRRRRLVTVRVVQVLVVVVFLAVWQWRGTSTPAWRLLIASPSDVGSVLREWAGDSVRWRDLWITLREASLGYLLGASAAVVLASVLSTSRFLTNLVTPFITALQGLPKLALLPVFIIWFGANSTQRVYYVSSVGFFVVFWSIFMGLLGIDRTVLINARVLGARRWWLIREVYAPSMLGWVVTSLRLGLAFSLLSASIAQLLGATEGMGAKIRLAQTRLDTPEVLAGIIVIAVVALLLDRLLVRVQRRFSGWRLT